MSRNEKSRAGSSWGHPTMALNHLPPKSPSVSSSTVGPPYPGCVRVPNYSAAREHRRSPSASFLPDVEPSWLEDLLDSPKAPERRVSHRRSASDSIAFLEAPSNLRRIADIAEEEEADSVASYDREDHLAALFSEMNPFRANEMLHNQVAANLDAWSLEARPHLRGFHGPGAIGKARMINEVELQQQQLLYDNEQGDSSVHQGDNLDPKRSKRQSAQRSRVRKLQYIHELEGNVNDLQNEVSALSTQVALLEHQRLALHLDNAALKQNVAALAQDRRQKDAHAEALEKECYRLRRLEKQQRLRQQLALASSTYNVETKPQQHQHVRRASAGSVQEMGSAADVVLDSFVKFVEKTDTPVLRSSCTLGKSLEVGGGGGGGGRLSGAPSLPPGFMLQNQ